MRYIPLLITKIFQADLDGDLDGSRTREKERIDSANERLAIAQHSQSEQELRSNIVDFRNSVLPIGNRIAHINCLLFFTCNIIKTMQHLRLSSVTFNKDKGQTLKLKNGIMSIHNEPSDEI
jgi:hypothetical protein